MRSDTNEKITYLKRHLTVLQTPAAKNLCSEAERNEHIFFFIKVPGFIDGHAGSFE